MSAGAQENGRGDTDAYVFADSVWIGASPEQVYDAVSDVTRHGEWSGFTRSCAWDAGDGPRVGAHFTGQNSRPGREWSTRGEVVAASPGREFAWEVGDGGVHWSYRMVPDDGGTRLTLHWEFRPPGRRFVREKFGEDGITLRSDDAHTSIPPTLAAIKRVLEHG